MKHILFIALILGCLSATVIAQSRGTFEFYDSNGVCWRCHPGLPCERCSSFGNPRLPVVPDTCPLPVCSDPANRPWLFPSVLLANYWQCMPAASGTWEPQEFTCPCDTIFDFENQGCNFPFNVRNYPCRFDLTTNNMVPCSDPTTTTTTELTTTTDPSATTTTDPLATTTTTAVDTTTTTTAATTTPTPCICVIWFPCRCNPCFNSRHPSCMMMGK